MSDDLRKTAAENAIDATKQKLWTPDQKVPESVRKMAFLFFLESTKARLNNPTIEKADSEKEYRACIELAKMIHRVDAENDPKT